MMNRYQTSPRRKSGYERFYEGYTEIETVDPDGHIRVHREYTGDYYRRQCSDRAFSLHRLRCLLAYLFSCGLFLLCALQSTAYNSTRLAALLEGLELVALLGFLPSLYYHLTAPREMVIRVYRDASLRYRRYAFFSAVCFWAPALLFLFNLAIYRVEPLRCLALAAGFAVCGAVMFALYREERNAVYETIPARSVRR